MEHEPLDSHFRDAVVEELRLIKRRPTVAWMGFHNLVQVTVACELFDEEARIVQRAYRHYKCFKALLWVRESEVGLRGTIVLMGSRQIYAVTLNTESGEHLWETPRQVRPDHR
jgi:hypothetical protein